ncbi:MAG: PA0069 family radical SAM protein [Planctomycetes bacterium]|nr:PA0069 family radical SAM protein [Planctomycetota bacterium]
MKRVRNPPNPYASEHHEWLEEPPAALPEVYVERARSILSENDSPDLHFRWSVNPYRGCQHACAYCYARPTHEYLGFGAGTDFETRLIVKENAPELLRKAFASRRWRGELVAFSGVTDCYQPLEAVWELTRRCLEVCRDFRNPACVVTKSYLIRRDADLLAEMAARSSMHVCMSIAFAGAEHSRLLEPQAPVPERRFEAMRALADAGVPVGVLFAPIIPGLNDSDIPTVLARAAECGATTASFVPLRLPGSVETVFLERLRDVLPLRAERVEHRLREIRGGALNDCRFGSRMTGQGEYWEAIDRLFEVSCRRNGLNKPPCVARPARGDGPGLGAACDGLTGACNTGLHTDGAKPSPVPAKTRPSALRYVQLDLPFPSGGLTPR